MTQLSLFDWPSTAVASPVANQPTEFPTRFPHTSNHRSVAAKDLAATPSPQTTLRRLAELIQEGNLHASSKRAGGIQPIGNLAREVVRRHDLMARRRQLYQAQQREQATVAIA